MCTAMFNEALFTIAEIQKQPKCPSTNEWIKKMWGVCVCMKYIYSYIYLYIYETERHSVMSDSLQPHRLYSPWNSPGQNTGSTFPSPGDLPNSGIKPRFPTLRVDFLLAEPQGKPKNTGVGSLSLLQHIFLTQELNWGLLHCRQILYQLSYQGSP